MPPRRTRASVPAAPPAPSPVTTLRPDPAIWRIALAMARGDASLLEVVDATTIVVHNES